MENINEKVKDKEEDMQRVEEENKENKMRADDDEEKANYGRMEGRRTWETEYNKRDEEKTET
jgi:hypothetical protein